MTRLLMLLYIIFSPSLNAQSIRVLTEHLPPMQIVEDNKIGGIATEIVTATFEKSELPYQIEANAWTISYKQTLKEPNTCLYSLAKLPSREGSFQWIGYIASISSSFYSTKEKNISMAKLDDAKKYKIAVVKDDATHHFLRDKGFVEGENLYIHHNYQTLLKLLATPSRQIDLLVLSNEMQRYRSERASRPDLYVELFKIEEATLHFHLACNLETDTKLLSTLQQNMAELERNGTFNKIRQKWGFGSFDILVEE